MSIMTSANLTCEYQINPLGIDVLQPRLSWQMQCDRRGAYQTAYHILAAASETSLGSGAELLWDSGKVETDQSTHVVYQGSPPVPGQRVYWKVKVWSEDGGQAESPSAWWEWGLLDSSDWQAEWITRTGMRMSVNHSRRHCCVVSSTPTAVLLPHEFMQPVWVFMKCA